MTEQKRGRGRPKKVVDEQKNPDCEPATKGYVKCIGRNITTGINHRHSIYLKSAVEIEFIDSLRFVSGIITVAFLVIAMLCVSCYQSAVHQLLWFGIGITCLSIAAVFLVIYVTASFSGDSYVMLIGTTGSSSIARANLPSLQKYTPPEPACEKKKECE